MSDDSDNGPDRPVGELWVELTKDVKLKICNHLIKRNKPTVLQDFDTLVRFWRDCSHVQQVEPPPSSRDACIGPTSLGAAEAPSDSAGKKRKNDGTELSDQPDKRTQYSVSSGSDTNAVLPVSSSQTAPLPEPAACGTPTTSTTTSSTLETSVPHPVTQSSKTPSIQSATAPVDASRIAAPRSKSDFHTSSTTNKPEYPFRHSNASTQTSNKIGTSQSMVSGNLFSANGEDKNNLGKGTSVEKPTGTAVLAFVPHLETESGTTSQNSFQNILFQRLYKDFSADELRMADYVQGRQYGNGSAGSSGAFGTPSGFGGGFGNNSTQNTGCANTSPGSNLFNNTQNITMQSATAATSVPENKGHPNDAFSMFEIPLPSNTDHALLASEQNPFGADSRYMNPDDTKCLAMRSSSKVSTITQVLKNDTAQSRRTSGNDSQTQNITQASTSSYANHGNSVSDSCVVDSHVTSSTSGTKHPAGRHSFSALPHPTHLAPQPVVPGNAVPSQASQPSVAKSDETSDSAGTKKRKPLRLSVKKPKPPSSTQDAQKPAEKP